MVKKITLALLGATAFLAVSSPAAFAAEQCHVAWSRYIGWEISHYIQETGIAGKWGEKKGVDLKFVYIGDYIESINQYAAGSFQGVTATTIDTLGIPAIGGVDSTIIVIGDYSNGNDAILVNDPAGEIQTVKDLKGRTVNVVEYSISDFLLQRTLQMNGLEASDVSIVNTSDADIGGVFATAGQGTVVVTWNPIVMTAMDNVQGAKILADSSSIPGEILDAVVVHTKASDACKSAITGAWFEAAAIMGSDTAEGVEAVRMMADNASGGGIKDAEGWFRAQLATTQMFYSPADAVAVATSSSLKTATDNVRNFAASRGLLGDGATADVVGIEFPDGSILGDSKNVKMRFDASYMQKAADGTL